MACYLTGVARGNSRCRWLCASKEVTEQGRHLVLRCQWMTGEEQQLQEMFQINGLLGLERASMTSTGVENPQHRKFSSNDFWKG
jgi:hypothetical protein